LLFVELTAPYAALIKQQSVLLFYEAACSNFICHKSYKVPLRNNMAIYIYFVTAPYAAPGTWMAMLFFYSGLEQRFRVKFETLASPWVSKGKITGM
jgi:hypothetical protein